MKPVLQHSSAGLAEPGLANPWLSLSLSYAGLCRAMEDLEDLRAELDKIDGRFGQFARQYDNFVTVAALRRWTAEKLHKDYKIPKGAAKSIAAAYLPSSESLLLQNPFCLSHNSWRQKSRVEISMPTYPPIWYPLISSEAHLFQNYPKLLLWAHISIECIVIEEAWSPAHQVWP